ncbi:MAG TPA: hypothetical protein VJQ25_00800 [Nitrospira sp.]|nr:hypothetical protein [Nitrospira sp.]
MFTYVSLERTGHIPIELALFVMSKHKEVVSSRLFRIAQYDEGHNVARPDATRPGCPESKKRNQINALVVEHDIEEGAMHMETVIPAQPTFVIMGEPISDIYLCCPRKNRLPQQLSNRLRMHLLIFSAHHEVCCATHQCGCHRSHWSVSLID